MLLEGRGGQFQRAGDYWREIPGGQFLAGDSWQAIPGGQFLAQLRKGKGKRKQSHGLIVMYFFDWVVGVI
jgi:hypothetical protein